MTQIRTLLAAAIITLPMTALAEGDSPWLPVPGDLAVTINHTQQSGDAAYIGSTEVPLSTITGGAASKYERSTTTLRLGYGVSDSVSVDATLGYGKVKVGSADKSSGQTDAIIGANWRVLDEFEKSGVPTVTLRAAAIINGNYDGARLAALGNDESGFELAALIGKQLTPTFGLWAEVGTQNRSGAIPNATFYELGARYRFAPQWSASLGYTDKAYSGNLDIGGPGFTPARFQEVKAERSIAKLGIGYAISGNQGVSLNLARLVNGRNTVKDDQIVGISYTHAFSF
jgi:hypothetical protein